MQQEHIEFQNISSPDRINQLRRLFERLKFTKDQFRNGELDDVEEVVQSPEWRTLLDAEAQRWFSDVFDYDSEEGLVWQKLWKLTKPDTRINNPFFNPPGNYPFESMLTMILESEYDLVEVTFDSHSGTGRLVYTPHSWPFGGTESLVALVESFGNSVIFDSHHEGPHKRILCKWDYQIAMKLVALNKGLD